MMSAPKVSVILITYNEEDNINSCLSSVQWADEIIVVDSYSKDKTVEIAQSYANCKVIHSTWKGFVPAKQLALQHTRNNWILWIDADERLTKELQYEITYWLKVQTHYIAF